MQTPCFLYILFLFMPPDPYKDSKKHSLTAFLMNELDASPGYTRTCCIHTFHNIYHSVLLPVICLTPLCLFCSDIVIVISDFIVIITGSADRRQIMFVDEWIKWEKWNQSSILLTNQTFFSSFMINYIKDYMFSWTPV